MTLPSSNLQLADAGGLGRRTSFLLLFCWLWESVTVQMTSTSNAIDVRNMLFRNVLFIGLNIVALNNVWKYICGL
jgi:hypothetical protein